MPLSLTSQPALGGSDRRKEDRPFVAPGAGAVGIVLLFVRRRRNSLLDGLKHLDRLCSGRLIEERLKHSADEFALSAPSRHETSLQRATVVSRRETGPASVTAFVCEGRLSAL